MEKLEETLFMTNQKFENMKDHLSSFIRNKSVPRCNCWLVFLFLPISRWLDLDKELQELWHTRFPLDTLKVTTSVCITEPQHGVPP